MQQGRPSLEACHGLLALELLLVVQSLKLWLKTAVSPLAAIVPPTLLLAQGIGITSGLAWMSCSRITLAYTHNCWSWGREAYGGLRCCYGSGTAG